MRGHRQRRGAITAGFTLLEILIASFVLLVTALGVVTLFTFSMGSNAAGFESTMTSNLGRSIIEEFLQVPFDSPRLAANADEIARLGRDMHERIAVFADHFTRMGRSIDKAVESYNKAAASLETRVLVTGRKLADRGATSKKELPAADRIDTRTRGLSAPEVADGEDDDELEADDEISEESET